MTLLSVARASRPWALWLPFSFALVAASAAEQASFTDANALYESGKFSEAAQAYEQCRAAGMDGADVLYNLGNCYAQQRQLGRALAAYRAARIVAPRDADVQFNIQQVAALRGEVPPPIPRSWLSAVGGGLLDRCTLSEFAVLALLALLACTVLAVAVLLRLGPVRRLTAALGACALLLLATGWATDAKHSRDYAHPPAFICAKQATLRSGPGEHFDVTGSLTDGTEVEVSGESGQWYELSLPEGRRAWVTRDDLATM